MPHNLNMAAKFTFNGVEISVPVTELAEAMRQLGLLVNTRSLIPQPRETVSSAPWPLPGGAAEKPKAELSSVLKFLKYVHDFGASGSATLQGVMQIMSVDNPKGVGSKSAAINRVLVAHGFKPDEVYVNPRDGSGERLWRPGSRIREAIEVIGKEDGSDLI